MRDPLAAAQWIEAHIDVAELSRKLVEKHGLAGAPAKVLALSPFEILTLFTRATDATDDVDRVAELHRINHEVRAPALPPSVPSWVLAKVPRRGRQ